jgi:hypothetical protein
MALQASKQSSDFDHPNGVLRESWIVWDTAGTANITADEVIVQLRANTTPAAITTKLYERKTWASAFARNSVRNTLRLRDFNVTMMQAGVGWIARLNVIYSTKWRFRNDVTVGDQCFLEVNRAVQPSQRMMQCYRDIAGSAAFPTGLTLESTTDIGGTKLDERGNPVMVPVPQVQVTLNSVIDSFQTDLTAYDAAWRTYGLTLNDAAFMGFPAYSCLMTDIGFTHIEDEYFNARISFLHDTYLFFDQVAKADTDGKIKIDTTNGQASDVRWKRANVETTTWTSLIGSTTWAYARLEKAEFGVTP